MGTGVAPVPFLDATVGMPEATKRRVLRKMLTTATGAALLPVPGGLLTRLLRFSPGALGVASGIILLIIAAAMVLGHPGWQQWQPAGRRERWWLSACHSWPTSQSWACLTVVLVASA
jgi:small neutral amino acid transporter SnatA (MarC family)